MTSIRTLLDIRYLPLLFAAAPQSYAVYLWQWHGSDLSTAAFVFAVLGALGYETIYVGAIAWTEDGRLGWGATITATVALLFSVAVAVFVHRAQGWASLLHAGFPIVAYAYTLHMHSAAGKHTEPARQVATAHDAATDRTEDLCDPSPDVSEPARAGFGEMRPAATARTTPSNTVAPASPETATAPPTLPPTATGATTGAPTVRVAAGSDEARIVEQVETCGRIGRSEVEHLLGVQERTAQKRLRALVAAGVLATDGKGEYWRNGVVVEVT